MFIGGIASALIASGVLLALGLVYRLRKRRHSETGAVYSSLPASPNGASAVPGHAGSPSMPLAEVDASAAEVDPCFDDTPADSVETGTALPANLDFTYHPERVNDSGEPTREPGDRDVLTTAQAQFPADAELDEPNADDRHTESPHSETVEPWTSLWADWDDDDLDLIEKRAANHHDQRLAITPLKETDNPSHSDKTVALTSSSPARAAAETSLTDRPDPTRARSDNHEIEQPTSRGIPDSNRISGPAATSPNRVARNDLATGSWIDRGQNQPNGHRPPDDTLDNATTTAFRTEPATLTGRDESELESTPIIDAPAIPAASEPPLSSFATQADLFLELEANPDTALLDDWTTDTELADDAPDLDAELDLLEDLPDTFPPGEDADEGEAPLFEIDTGGASLGHYEKATRQAAKVVQHTGRDEEALWPILLDIFLESPWPITRQSIESILNGGASCEALALTVEIRRMWMDHPEFAHAAAASSSPGSAYLRSEEARSRLSWPRAAKLAELWSGYPDVAEIEHLLESLCDRWQANSRLGRAFPSFPLYVGYATGDLGGTLDEWPEFSFEMDENLQDPFDRIESPDCWQSLRTELYRYGIERPMVRGRTRSTVDEDSDE